MADPFRRLWHHPHQTNHNVTSEDYGATLTKLTIMFLSHGSWSIMEKCGDTVCFMDTCFHISLKCDLAISDNLSRVFTHRPVGTGKWLCSQVSTHLATIAYFPDSWELPVTWWWHTHTDPAWVCYLGQMESSFMVRTGRCLRPSSQGCDQKHSGSS